jgi:hypothetical protein
MADFPPLVLAGPILRRCDTSMVTVWIATSEDLPRDATLAVFDYSKSVSKTLDTSVDRTTITVGERLFIHLFIARSAGFPTGKLLAYDLKLGGSRALDYENLTYDKKVALPTFHLQPANGGIRMMHGSCRKPYGIGADALAAADTLIGEALKDLRVKADKKSSSGRPAVLYLTGDQIYADDVEKNLFGVVVDLAIDLFIYVEHVPNGYSDIRNDLDRLIYGGERKNFTLENVHFTTDDGEGHLLGLSEYCAMYLLVWSQLAWTPALARKLPRDGGFKYPSSTRGGLYHSIYFGGQVKRKSGCKVADMYDSLPAVRRAMANVPCYMIFDDHDVTDDWNWSAGWKAAVESSDAGRRVVANALAAYWLFQGWGNDPDSFPESFAASIKEYCEHQASQDGQVGRDDKIGKEYEKTLLEYTDWMFHIPTNPPTLFADMRTQREFGGIGKAGSALAGQEARKQLKAVAKKAGHKAGMPLVIVSSLPVLNHPILAIGQNIERKLNTRETADWEQWGNNQRGLITFLRFVGDELQPEYCVFLSGEIHHSLTAGSDLYVGRHNAELLKGEDVYYPADQNWRMIQLTSSPLKNENATVAKYMVPNGLTDWLSGSDIETQTIVFLRGRTPASDFVGLPLAIARQYIDDPSPSRILMIEKDEFVRDSSNEADTPIQPRSCLGVVTLIPDAAGITHECCVVTKVTDFSPKIEKRWSVVDAKRTPYPKV